MVTGDQGGRPTEETEAAPTAEEKPEECRHGWHDGRSGHVCYLPKGHPSPHVCSSVGCKGKDKFSE